MAQQGLIQTGLASMEQWNVLREQANVLLKSGYLPQHIKTPEQAIAIVMTGQELGISPTRALSGITVIQGKPTLGAELMAVLIYRDHGPDALVFRETTNDRCVLAYKRRAASQGGEYTFSMADAAKAGLAQSQTWQKFPAAMLRARCISAVARFAFPDSIAGCYTPEEMGAEVTVHGDSVDVVSIPQAEAPKQITAGNGHSADDAPAPSGLTPAQIKAELPALIARVKDQTGEVFDLSAVKTVAQARSLHGVLLDILAKEAEFAADPAPEASPI